MLGPKRLPEAGKSLGNGMREFKDSLAGVTGGDDDDERTPAVEAAAPAAPAAAPVVTPSAVATPSTHERV